MACAGTPAMGIGWPPCWPRAVSVMPRTAAAFWASSKNSSKKSPMRKNTSASGWLALASKYCAITGVAPAASGVWEIWAFMNAGDARGRVRRPHPLNGVMRTPSCGWMSRERVDTQFVIFPAGPADAEDLARVHAQSWRETYKGLLPDAYLARMSEPGHARRFAQMLIRPGP